MNISLNDALTDEKEGFKRYGNRSEYFRIKENINCLNISPFGKKKSKGLTQSTCKLWNSKKSFILFFPIASLNEIQFD